MLRKRIIFSLIYSQGFFNQSRNFRLQKVGNLNWLERNYKFQKIAFSLDELLILNAERGDKKMNEFAAVIAGLVNDVFIPVAAGGGIRTLEDAELLFKSGADKIVLNTVLYENPELVGEIASIFGAQSIVASVDYKRNGDENKVYIHDGSKKIEVSLNAYLQRVMDLGVGEVYLNSIDMDGTGFGYDFDTIKRVEADIKCPLIIAGGAGNETHLIQGLTMDGVSAVATANLFNFVGDGLPLARKKIIATGGNIANWSRMIDER